MALKLVRYNHGDGEQSVAIADVEGDRSMHTIVFPSSGNPDGWDDPVHTIVHEVKEGTEAGTFSN